MGLILPEGILNDYSKFELQENKIGCFFDIHIPYHHPHLEVAINYLRKWGPSAIIYGGDIADCYQASDFTKDPRNKSLAQERSLVRAFFEYMFSVFPKARHIYKIGNHEERYERIIFRNAALIDAGINTWPEFMENEWHSRLEYVDNKRLIKAGSLNIGHGHEMGKGGGVNVARWYQLKAMANFMGGDKHKTASHDDTNIDNKTYGAWGVGCLCDLHPKYLPNNKWNHGFATVELEGDYFTVENKKIIDGKVR